MLFRSVSLRVYDILGREAATLVDGPRSPGLHEVAFHADNLSNGVYFYTLTMDGRSVTKKLLVVK